MAVRSFQARLLFLLIAVLVLLEAGTLVSVYLAGQRTLRRSVAEELRVGARVLNRILDTRARQLADSTRVTALDFAFRDAVASADMPTVTSALQNHGKRVASDAVVLIDLNGVVTADTLSGRLTGKRFPFPALLHQAEEHGEASATVSFLERPYQFAIVPVLGPRPIAWVGAGFEIDERVLTDVERLTSLEVAIGPAAANANDAGYATLLQHLPTGDGSRVDVLLRRSLDEARKPFVTLQLQIAALSSLILIVAVFAAVIFARSVSRPLRVLADGAARIGRGDYVEPIVVREEDEIGKLATAFNQMQSAIAAREDKITHQATHDALTELPNRTLFFARVSQAIAGSKRSGASVGMIMMDVDRFKEINDTLGHHFGDQLLIEIGRRLEQTAGPNDTVARLGGDEFAFLFTTPSAERANDFAERVGTAFDAPFVLGDVAIDVDASLGIALFPTHAEDADTLMKRADIAMYDAKKSLSGVAMYEAGRDEHSLRRLSLMMELRQAIARDALELFFQPKIDVRTERVVHVEALVRWKHAVHGIMRPDEFIPLAEQSGNIGLITRWVLRKAIVQCAAWNRAGLDLTVAVNLSALDLFDSELPTFISGLLSEAGLPPTRLVLEITESAVMQDTAYALKILSDLKARGIVLAIDDFGTGYSSLGHLKRLPVDELKIDKSFVLNLSESAKDDLMIVRSTIELGHNMGLVVIAEGVETQESWGILKRLGCDMAQGYFMSPPLPAAKFEEWFGSSRWGGSSSM
ncbi:MAG: EAL domain-containing protein [Acidobacteria bacterium]|nr:EAL domain-containing protein [Acidobacteriota bacterium]